MKVSFPTFFKLSLLIVFAIPFSAHAWGERGHHTICEVATHLVTNPNLKTFLSKRGHMFGHICNIPDIGWRSLKDGLAESNPTSIALKLGEDGHNFNPQNIGFKSAADVPTDLNQVRNQASKQKTDSKLSVDAFLSEALGTLWWRAEQFRVMAIQSARLAISAPKPTPGVRAPLNKDGKPDSNFVPNLTGTAQDPNQPYNKAVFNFEVYMALMGHFIGDASMPYHNISDFNGIAAGHGGIHGFFEGDCVDALDPGFEGKVFNLAKKITPNNYLLLTRIKALSAGAEKRVPEIELIDNQFGIIPGQKPETDPVTGKTKRFFPKRNSAAVVAPHFETIIEEQMAKSAALLAQTWDKMYVEAGSPDLSAYQSFIYPLAPTFVPVDYLK